MKTEFLNKNAVAAGGREYTSIPDGLEPLAEEARKCSTFDEFKTGFLGHLKHGLYWHLTDNPDFRIDSGKGPRDMSSMADGGVNKGSLMITSHLEHWDNYYNYDRDDELEISRPYAAKIDMSQIPWDDYGQVSRGFGNEFFLEDSSKARVEGVYPREQALSMDKRYRNLLDRYIMCTGDLRYFWEVATGKVAKTASPKSIDVVAYHSTNKDFDHLQLGSSGLIWFSDSPEFTKSWGSRLLKARIHMDNPDYYVDSGMHHAGLEDTEGVEDLKSEGYDGVVIINEGQPTNYAVTRLDQVEVLSEEVPKTASVTNSPAFRAWFGNSKVVDAEGNPKIVFHGTLDDFDEFRNGDIGFHVGTNEQAEKRISIRQTSRPKEQMDATGYGHTMPLYARIENPLKMPDVGDWDDPWEVYGAANDATKGLGYLANDINKLMWEGGAAPSQDYAGPGLTLIRAALINLGYDGIQYENRFEGEGTSWICFDSSQVKSAIANDGSFDAKSKSITASALRSQIEHIMEDMQGDVDAAFDSSGDITDEGNPWGNCTVGAEHIIELVGHGDIYGYQKSNNPTAQIADGAGEGGHDFAIIDDLLVDFWAMDYMDTPGIIPLSDVEQIHKLYGDPNTWEKREGNVRLEPGVGVPEVLKKTAAWGTDPHEATKAKYPDHSTQSDIRKYIVGDLQGYWPWSKVPLVFLSSEDVKELYHGNQLDPAKVDKIKEDPESLKYAPEEEDPPHYMDSINLVQTDEGTVIVDGNHRIAAASLMDSGAWVRIIDVRGMDREAILRKFGRVKTAGLKDWFGDSKVVDHAGNPRVVYHGSMTRWLTSFDLGMEGNASPVKNKRGAIWFTSSYDNAEFYADGVENPPASTDIITSEDNGNITGFVISDDEEGGILFSVGPYATEEEVEEAAADEIMRYESQREEEKRYVISCYLKIENPLYIEVIPRDNEFAAAKAGGHDGIIAQNVSDGPFVSDIFVVFDPKQVKEVNAKEFNPGDHRIRASRISPKQTSEEVFQRHGDKVAHNLNWDRKRTQEFISGWMDDVKKGKPGASPEYEDADNYGKWVWRDERGIPQAFLFYSPKGITEIGTRPKYRGKGAMRELLAAFTKERGWRPIVGPYTELGEAVAKKHRENYSNGDEAKTAAMPEEAFKEQVAVDLDGTIAMSLEDYSDPLVIGEPIPEMIEKIQGMLEAGIDVVVFTARLADKDNAEAIKKAIFDYTEEHIGVGLDSTNQKTPGMVAFLDDKAHHVEENTGKVASSQVKIVGSQKVSSKILSSVEVVSYEMTNLMAYEEDGGGADVLEVSATLGDKKVGVAHFRVESDALFPLGVQVSSAYRRRGIATGMYEYAKKETGLPIDSNPDMQTGDGIAFREKIGSNTSSEEANYLGNCIDSFDDDGDCTNPLLPWNTVSDFANSVEEHGNEFTLDGVRVEYDEGEDTHYFYDDHVKIAKTARVPMLFCPACATGTPKADKDAEGNQICRNCANVFAPEKAISMDEAEAVRSTKVAAYPANALQDSLMSLRPQLAEAAQDQYDAWEASDPEYGDGEVGFGGICQLVADAMADVIRGHIPDAEIEEGGAEGDDHAWLLVYKSNGEEVYEVDIPPGVYETGSGYSWAKIPNVKITGDDVYVGLAPVKVSDITGEFSKRAYMSPMKEFDWSGSVEDVIKRLLLEKEEGWLRSPIPLVPSTEEERDAIYPKVEAVGYEKYRSGQTEMIDPLTLTTTQEAVQVHRVLGFLEDPDRINTEKDKFFGDAYPVVIRVGDRYQVWEGNHRASAAWVLKKPLKATVLDESQVKVASPDFGYSQYNDRDEEIQELRWEVTEDNSDWFTIRAKERNPDGGWDEIAYITCEHPDEQGKLSPSDFTIAGAYLLEPGWEGTGLGQLLYDKAVEVCIKKGAKRLYADKRQNQAANKAWERLSHRYPVGIQGGRNFLELVPPGKQASFETDGQSSFFEPVINEHSIRPLVAPDPDPKTASTLPNYDAFLKSKTPQPKAGASASVLGMGNPKTAIAANEAYDTQIERIAQELGNSGNTLNRDIEAALKSAGLPFNKGTQAFTAVAVRAREIGSLRSDRIRQEREAERKATPEYQEAQRFIDEEIAEQKAEDEDFDPEDYYEGGREGAIEREYERIVNEQEQEAEEERQREEHDKEVERSMKFWEENVENPAKEFCQWLESKGIQEEMYGYNNNPLIGVKGPMFWRKGRSYSSLYFFIEVGDADILKVRFSDHEQKNGEGGFNEGTQERYEAADISVDPETDDLQDAKAAVEDLIRDNPDAFKKQRNSVNVAKTSSSIPTLKDILEAPGFPGLSELVDWDDTYLLEQLAKEKGKVFEELTESEQDEIIKEVVTPELGRRYQATVDLLSQPNLTLYRAIQVQNGISDVQAEYEGALHGDKGVGVCWSWDESGANAYCSNIGVAGKKVVLRGEAELDAVDIEATLYCNVVNDLEKEVRLKPGSTVDVTGYKVGGSVTWMKPPQHLRSVKASDKSSVTAKFSSHRDRIHYGYKMANADGWYTTAPTIEGQEATKIELLKPHIEEGGFDHKQANSTLVEARKAGYDGVVFKDHIVSFHEMVAP